MNKRKARECLQASYLMLVLLVMMVVVGAVTACSSAEHTAPGTYRQITMSEAAKWMVTENNYVILDVRTEDEFTQGHIPGAICIPNETIGEGEIPQLPDKDQLILVYCRSGNRSKQASQKLVDLGYTNIVEFGGILDWQGKIVTE